METSFGKKPLFVYISDKQFQACELNSINYLHKERQAKGVAQSTETPQQNVGRRTARKRGAVAKLTRRDAAPTDVHTDAAPNKENRSSAISSLQQSQRTWTINLFPCPVVLHRRVKHVPTPPHSTPFHSTPLDPTPPHPTPPHPTPLSATETEIPQIPTLGPREYHVIGTFPCLN